jgi:hypothetical protein
MRSLCLAGLNRQSLRYTFQIELTRELREPVLVLRFGKTSLVLRPSDEGSLICLACRPIYDETALMSDGWANA